MSDKDDVRMSGNTDSELEVGERPGMEKSSECDSDAWWNDRTIPEKVVIGIGFGILGIGLMALFIWAVMGLWNWLMPELFGLKTVTYWQSGGLLLLSCILFKGVNFGNSDRGSERRRKKHLRRYMREEAEGSAV